MIEHSEKIKIYPEAKIDSSGIKYYFNHEKHHFTLHFAGNPMLLLEYLYKKRGWKQFWIVYAKARAEEPNYRSLTYELSPEELSLNMQILQDATSTLKELMETMAYMDMKEKSPFVVYVNNYDPNR